MQKYGFIVFFIFYVTFAQSQTPSPTEDSTTVSRDSIKKTYFLKQLGNGYFPSKYINLDLRYLVKYNQYEGLRTGLGGSTNELFSDRYRLNSYVVYGFRDDRFKYSFGGGFRIAKKTNTWLNVSYTNDLEETGSSAFLTDKRFFQFFEPRLLNIDLFHKHITTAITLEHQLSNYLLSETEFAVRNINTTYSYNYVFDGKSYNQFHLTTAKVALQWSPFSKFITTKNNVVKETKNGYPKLSLQYTKAIDNVLSSNLSFSKVDFRLVHRFQYNPESYTEATIVSGLANGNTPLTHLYHAYPNNITKETIFQRFSVAGINSFETMYFNEFFSDKFSTVQLKHYFKPFNITNRFKPQLVLITRYAVGQMSNIEHHENVTFDTLDKGYTESGLEINKLFFGFGLSFAYRYGAYHLPKQTDNMALKFTFNVSL